MKYSTPPVKAADVVLTAIAGAVWVTAHGFTLPDDFIGLPRPDVA